MGRRPRTHSDDSGQAKRRGKVAAAASPPPPKPRSRLAGFWASADRGAVLVIGVFVGMVIGAAFVRQSVAPPAIGRAPPPKPAAQIAADCPLPFSPHLMAKIARGDPVTVAVFGDSFGDGVWAALYQDLPRHGKYQVLRFSKEATGFTRYASLNLEDEATSQLKGQDVDVAVVVFGANDTQGIWDGHHGYTLLSDGWKSIYGARMDRYVSVLRAHGAMVYWVGLPKMRKPDYDRQIADMSEFLAGRTAQIGVPFLPTRPLSVDAAGQFNDYLSDPDSKEPRLMRANDGVHMTFAGYERITAPLTTRIEAYVHAAEVAAALDAPKDGAS